MSKAMMLEGMGLPHFRGCVCGLGGRGGAPQGYLLSRRGHRPLTEGLLRAKGPLSHLGDKPPEGRAKVSLSHLR